MWAVMVFRHLDTAPTLKLVLLYIRKAVMLIKWTITKSCYEDCLQTKAINRENNPFQVRCPYHLNEIAKKRTCNRTDMIREQEKHTVPYVSQKLVFR
jgi:hypothetical protein